MKKLLFVVNTLSTAGAENALVELLSRLDPAKYEINLYVLMNQGNLIDEVPGYVKLLNKNFDKCNVLDKIGKKHIIRHVLITMFKHGAIFKLLPYVVRELARMLKEGKFLKDKLLWQVMACGADRFTDNFDLAVAFHEGGSSYYVSRYVNAVRKVSFLHISYSDAGYCRSLDDGIYDAFERIFGVSYEVVTEFLKVYPELSSKVGVLHNLISIEKLLAKAGEGAGFNDEFDGTRIITVGRLHKQKAYEISIAAARLLKDRGHKVRWYVLGEGEERSFLEREIKRLKVENEFLLMGNVENPYPYFKACDIYVHASKFEGKSIAIQEAQIFERPIITTNCNGNREQVVHEYDGLLCEIEPQQICECIERLINDKETAALYAKRAHEKIVALLEKENDLNKLLSLVSEEDAKCQ